MIDSFMPSANLALTRYEYACQALVNLHNSLPSKIVYDIGAGDGRMKIPVESEGFEWHGFDLKPSSDEITSWNLALSSCPKKEIRAGAVLLLDVMEHLDNPGAALAHIADSMHPDGRLILTVPNPRWSRSRIHALYNGCLTCFTEADLINNSHLFATWPHMVIHILSEAGFEIEEYVTLDGKTTWPGRPISFRYPLRFLNYLACMLIESRDASACGMSYGIIARIIKK